MNYCLTLKQWHLQISSITEINYSSCINLCGLVIFPRIYWELVLHVVTKVQRECIYKVRNCRLLPQGVGIEPWWPPYGCLKDVLHLSLPVRKGLKDQVPVSLCQCIISWPAISPTYRCETVARCQNQERLAPAGASPPTAGPARFETLFAIFEGCRWETPIRSSLRSNTVSPLCSQLKAEANTNCSPFVDAALFRCWIYRGSCLLVVWNALKDQGGVYSHVHAELWSVYIYIFKAALKDLNVLRFCGPSWWIPLRRFQPFSVSPDFHLQFYQIPKWHIPLSVHLRTESH